jgi:hypothetical protein
MLQSTLFHKNGLGCTPKSYKQKNPLHTGDTVVYEGNTCRVTQVSPFLVIKCGNRVVCGNLSKQIKPVKSYRP